jgi:hypothetical protein
VLVASETTTGLDLLTFYIQSLLDP